ncbi:hypothetical protein OESDEN_06518 [Oesophagostomum dentatum]|uniref:Uncharacterized protein n=1 Tax=Oesophagostomum dentatum TaxID=61180 RepID=A0A0B1TCL4_OESDE|nr:hypothetical protein OESDEN_06518 [Oesophagostomum dentatum]
MLIHCAAVVWGYLGFSILFRIQETNYNSLRPVGLGQYLVQSRNWPFYHPYAIIATFVASLVLMMVAPVALYSYGYNKYFHEEKPLLLTCIIMDVVYLFTWILLWLMLTLKREWSFNVAHKVHQIYALQKGLATGHIKGNENPSQLKNSLIVMQRDHMFVTDDQAAKQSLLRHIQRGHFDTPDEMYWSKSNGNQGSPNTRKLPLEESSSNTPETSRLIQRSMEDSTATYNSPSVSASSSQQEQCFTPTSTLTSQGSASNYDGQTPTPGSPQTSTPLYGRTTNGGGGGSGGVYGTVGDDPSSFGDRTLQKPNRAVSTGSTSVRHNVKVVGPRTDDSANFSLTSSNGSSEANKTNNDFATSIV